MQRVSCRESAQSGLRCLTIQRLRTNRSQRHSNPELPFSPRSSYHVFSRDARSQEMLNDNKTTTEILQYSNIM